MGIVGDGGEWVGRVGNGGEWLEMTRIDKCGHKQMQAHTLWGFVNM